MSHYVAFLHLTLTVLLATRCDSRCTSEFRNKQCDSLEDVERAGEQTDWTTLLIKSFGESQRIKASTFARIPNIRSIIFNNSVDAIDANAFRDLQSLHELFFVSCDLPSIKRNWFRNLPIARLQFAKSRVRALDTRCLEGLANLTAFDMSENSISRVNANVFSYTNLVHLFLDQNEIQVIDDSAFANMEKLRILSLRANSLTSFNRNMMGGTSGLLQLVLEGNSISYLNQNDFLSFPQLTFLYLKSNALERIEDGAFNGLSQLKYLDVSENKLMVLTERAFPFNGLPALQTLFLQKNRLNYMSRSFVVYFPKLERISIFGNPWQCGCYPDIRNSIYYKNVTLSCAEQYLNGERPVCVVPDVDCDRCVENASNSYGLYETYINVWNEYTGRNSLDSCFLDSSEVRELLFMKILFRCQFMCRVA